MGRTALDWATARAQVDDMKLLIRAGSSVDTMDTSGRTTVLHAVDSHNEDALRIILEAGADPNPKVPSGCFRSSPLTAASFGGLVGMVKLLVLHGAEVDAFNPEGRTALLTVARMQSVECADILVTHGADVCYVSSDGHSPLTTAISYNNHAVLNLFISRCSIICTKELQLLSVIAGFAYMETMSILLSSDRVKQALLNEGNFAYGREILQHRSDCDEQLLSAFENLCLGHTRSYLQEIQS